MTAELKEHWDKKGEYNGYFELYNVQSGKNSFSSYWIYINSIDQDGYKMLLSMNNTEEKSADKNFINIRKHLNGYVRDIYFTSHDSVNNYDPTKAE